MAACSAHYSVGRYLSPADASTLDTIMSPGYAFFLGSLDPRPDLPAMLSSSVHKPNDGKRNGD